LGASFAAQPEFPVENGGKGTKCLLGRKIAAHEAHAAHPDETLRTEGVLLLILHQNPDGPTEIDRLGKCLSVDLIE
jgi:hypothetical protein